MRKLQSLCRKLNRLDRSSVVVVVSRRRGQYQVYQKPFGTAWPYAPISPVFSSVASCEAFLIRFFD